MAVQEQKADNAFDRYIAEVRAVWGDGKDPQLPYKVAGLMEKLFASTSPDDPWMAELIRDGKPSPNAKDRTDRVEKTAAKFFDSFKITK